MTIPRAEDRRFPVGTILKGHGLAGQVKVRTAMHDSSHLATGMTLLAELPDGERRELLLTAVHGAGHQLRLAFAGIVDREGGRPVLTFRHYSVDGEILNEDRRPAE